MTTMDGVKKGSQLVTKFFVLWVIIAAVLAFAQPESFAWLGDYISYLLAIVMLGMGMTLTIEDFRRILERPRDVVLGAVAQWVIMPISAYALVVFLSLPAEIGIGLILLGAAPGGTASNVYTYLGKGDVALSVTVTSVTTLAAPIVMPAWIILFVGEQINVTFGEMFQEIVLIVVIPVILGIILRRALDKRAPRAAEAGLTVFPAISVLAIVTIVAAVIGGTVDNLLTASGIVILAVLIHHAIGLASGYGTGYLTNMSDARSRALSFEVGMQNSALAVAIAATFFSPLASLVPAVAVVLHQIAGPAVASYYASQDDETLYEATTDAIGD
ncbi:sodium symporter [Natrialba magadii ATCC 43099]|uniref:Sodium symporter n=2 Tax=Natrialba magadii (strain ATCC 43099 / DSM 3394 / CCM 3739 / CIP 104546 / IAM 13178 / JCM 8861 / NBRC 102185 / NCIMB 2190 / MS3) TaxID=547559 RepID=L9V122_NATMM|nr:bile acid:sodium symporter family protein [Natrialba magadii]ELY30018.1 sodium symporter [Natrialba magadii ATCC 43099]